MPGLTRDQILAIDDVSSSLTAVDVPEWGGTIYVRAMTAGERARMEGAISKGGVARLRSVVAAMCIADEDGKPLFSDADIPALDAKSSKALDRVLAVADRLNVISKDEMARVGEPSGPDRP